MFTPSSFIVPAERPAKWLLCYSNEMANQVIELHRDRMWYCVCIKRVVGGGCFSLRNVPGAAQVATLS